MRLYLSLALLVLLLKVHNHIDQKIRESFFSRRLSINKKSWDISSIYPREIPNIFENSCTIKFHYFPTFLLQTSLLHQDFCHPCHLLFYSVQHFQVFRVGCHRREKPDFTQWNYVVCQHPR